MQLHHPRVAEALAEAQSSLIKERVWSQNHPAQMLRRSNHPAQMLWRSKKKATPII